MTMLRPILLLWLLLLSSRPSVAQPAESEVLQSAMHLCHKGQIGMLEVPHAAPQKSARHSAHCQHEWTVPAHTAFELPNGTAGTVYAVATDGEGKWYVGGNFTLVHNAQNLSVNNIACFDAKTNMWSALGDEAGNGVNGEVRAILVLGNTVYVGGEFTQACVGAASPVAVHNLARFDRSTGKWSALGAEASNGVNGRVYALSALGVNLFVGGDFTEANVGGPATIAVKHLAVFNIRNNTWSALGSAGVGVNGVVYALAASGEEIFIGGDFTEANVGSSTLKANGIVRVNLTTNKWSVLGTGSGNGVGGASQPAVYAIAISGEEIFVGGEFTQVNAGAPISANYIARFNTSTNMWSALGKAPGNGVNSAVNAIAVVGNTLYVGGFFTKANLGATLPVMASYVARFHLESNLWSVLSSGNGVNSEVYAIAASGNDVFIGGSFTQANVGTSSAMPASFIVRFNAGTNTWSVVGFNLGYQKEEKTKSHLL